MILYLSLKTIGSISFGYSYWKFNNSLLEGKAFSENLSFYIKVLSKQDVTLDTWNGIKDKVNVFIMEYSKMKRRETYEGYSYSILNVMIQLPNLLLRQNRVIWRKNSIKARLFVEKCR